MRFTCEQVRLHLTHLLTLHLRYATEQNSLQRTKKTRIEGQNIHLQSTYYF